MPPFDIRGARGRGNPHPKRKRARPIPTHLYTPISRQGRKAVPRKVVTRKGRAVVTKRAYRPDPKRVVSHKTVVRAQRSAKHKAVAKRKAQINRTINSYYKERHGQLLNNPFWSGIADDTPQNHLRGRANAMQHARERTLQQDLHKPLYRAYVKHLWPKVRKEYGLPKGTPMPKLHFPKTGTRGSYRLEGDVFHERPNDIYVTPQVAKNAFSAGPQRNFARALPLHEWAHTQQSRKGRKSLPKWLIEGGAEAFSEDIAKKLKLPSGHGGGAEYARYVKKVRKRKGKKYIHRGQFR